MNRFKYYVKNWSENEEVLSMSLILSFYCTQFDAFIYCEVKVPH